MNVSKIVIPFEACALAKTAHVVSVSKLYEYTDNKRGDKQIGNTYEVCFIRNGFEKQKIKCEGEVQPSITNEAIQSAGGSVEVEVIDFVGRIYASSSNSNSNSSSKGELTAKAKAVIPVKKV